MSGKGGHHGGAWKVAYADFVTAMMALFLVLWIVAMSQEMKESIAGYFRSTALLNRTKSGVGSLAPITQMSRTMLRNVPPNPSSAGDRGGEMWATRNLISDPTLRETATAIQKLLRRNNNNLTDTDAFRFEFTNDGFRIQVMDQTTNALFLEGTDELTEYGKSILDSITWEVDRYAFDIEVEGHTQGGDVDDAANRWELSTRRAMTARQYMESKGVNPKQFWRVAGYADRQLLDPLQPEKEINRRITVVVRLNPNTDPSAIRRAFRPVK